MITANPKDISTRLINVCQALNDLMIEVFIIQGEIAQAQHDKKPPLTHKEVKKIAKKLSGLAR